MSAKHVHVEIETRTVVRVLLIVVGFFLALMFVKRMATALTLIGMAFFLALALNSSVSYLARHLPGKSRALATGVSYLAVVSILGILLFSTVPTVFRETSSFVENIPGYVDTVKDKDSTVGKLIQRYQLQDEIDDNLNKVKSSAGEWATTAVGKAGQLTSSIAMVVTVLVLTFLMLVEAPRWQRLFWGLYTDDTARTRHQKLAARMYRVVTGYVNGQVSIAAIGGASALVILLILSAIFDTSSSLALPLAGIIFVAELIPMVGATIGAILVSLFLLLTSIPMALAFLAYFIAYQQFENYVIQPVVQSKALDLSPLIVFASALLGFYLMGPIGGFVAIPIAGCIRVLILDYLAHHRSTATAPKKEAKKELAEIET